MRIIAHPDLNKSRVRYGELKTDDLDGLMGAFELKTGQDEDMFVLSSGPAHDWEHVSVSVENRCPTWEEMCLIKDLFWGEEETVIQYHPPKSEYVNRHPYCLHLWKPVGVILPRPPKEYVG